MKNLNLSIIIPCYNEEAVINKTYRRVKEVLNNNKLDTHEIIFINDGSKDKTRELLSAIANQDKTVKIIHFSRNFGHQAGVSAGVNICTGDIAIIIDADMQDPPELFPEMLKIHREQGANVVYGVRRSRRGESLFKIITAKIFYRIINLLSDTELPSDTGDFRLIDRKVIDEFKKLDEKNKYIRGIIAWIGFKQVSFLYDREPRMDGETKYPLRKMFSFATNGLLYFTTKPLSIAIAFGFINTIIGLLLAAYVLIAKLFDTTHTVQGWASTLIIIIFFGGIQLLSVGLLGKYIGSIFEEVKKRPEYIIESTQNIGQGLSTETE